MPSTIPTNLGTWADLINLVRQSTFTHEWTRTRVLYSLRLLPNLLHTSPHKISLEPAALRETFQRIDHLLWIRGQRYRSTQRYHFRLALRLANICRLPGRSRSPLLTTWKHLKATISTNISKSNSISRFSHFCSDLGLETYDITPHTFSLFSTLLDNDPMIIDPRLIVRRTMNAWRWCQLNIPDLHPHTLLTPPANKHLPWSAFPKRLFEECRRSVEQIHHASRVNSQTVATNLDILRRSASTLGQSGPLPQTISELTNPQSIAMICKTLKGRGLARAAYTTACLLSRISTAIHQGTDNELRSLSHIRRNLRPRLAFSENRLRKAMVFRDTAALANLLWLPEALFSEVTKIHSARDANKLQVAAALDILLFIPMRISQLCRLEIGHSLWIEDDSVTIQVTDWDGVSTIALPRGASTRIAVYVREGRDRLKDAAKWKQKYLFAGRTRPYKSTTTLRTALSKEVLRLTGNSITPEDLRWIAISHYSSLNPGKNEITRAVLGTKSLHDQKGRGTGLEAYRAVELLTNTVVKRSSIK